MPKGVLLLRFHHVYLTSIKQVFYHITCTYLSYTFFRLGSENPFADFQLWMFKINIFMNSFVQQMYCNYGTWTLYIIKKGIHLYTFVFQQVREIIEGHLLQLNTSVTETETEESTLLVPGVWPDVIPSVSSLAVEPSLATICQQSAPLLHHLNQYLLMKGLK